MRTRPFFCIGLASFLAVLACSVLPLIGAIVVMAVLLSALGVVLVWRRHDGTKTMTAAFLVALVLCGTFLLKHYLVVYPAVSYAGNTAYVTVRVEETVSVGSLYTVKTVDGDLPGGMRMCLWLDGKASPAVGDRLTAQVMLKAALDKHDDRDDGYDKANGVYLYAFVEDEVPLVWEDGIAERTLGERIVCPLREAIRNTLYRRLPFEDAALCESMVLGSQTNLSPTVASDFRVCGVYHLLVVSGLHLSLIAGVVLKLLRGLRVPRTARVITAMGAAVLFAALCGFGASVTRACLMTLIVLVAQLVHRDGDGLNSLGLAAVVMLAIDPFCIYDHGWQLSFAATLGVLLILPVWEREVTARVRKRWCRAVVSAVGVALSATLMTQPLCAMYFGELSLVFLIGNLLCVTVSSVILMLCLLSFAVTAIPLVSDGIYGAIRIGCAFLTQGTAWLAKTPFAMLTIQEPFAVVWFFALAVVICVAYALLRTRGVLRATALMLSVLFVSVTVFAFTDSGVSTVHVLPSSSTALMVDTKDSRGLVFEGDSGSLKNVSARLTSAGIRELDWLLWLDTAEESIADPTWLSVAVKTLVTVDEPSTYERLPIAACETILRSGETWRFSAHGAFARDRQAFYLRLGQTEMVLCPKIYGEMALADAWQTADVMLLRGTIPRDLNAMDTDTVVVYAPYEYETYYDAALPHTFETVHYAMADGVVRIQTRGYGDITLRDG